MICLIFVITLGAAAISVAQAERATPQIIDRARSIEKTGLKLAATNYDQAIKSCSEKEVELKKLALYRAGVLAMGMAKLEKDQKFLDTAENHLTELAALDFGYRDVAERLDKISDLRHKG